MATVSKTGSPLAQNALLSAYLAALATNPIRTKMITSGVLSGISEILAGKLAGVAPASSTTPPSQVSQKAAAQQAPLSFVQSYLQAAGLNDRAVKMIIYGGFISAPLGHVLTGLLQRAFAGRTSAKDKVLQIITSNLTVAVIANTVYLTSMAYINGARSIDRIVAAVKASFWPVMRVSWLTSPVAIAFAQNYLPPEVWEPFFTVLRFFLSTYFNTLAKKRQMALARAEAAKKGRTESVDKDLEKGAAQGK